MNQPKTKTNVTLRDYLRFLTRYLRPRLYLVFALGITLLISIALQLINPQILRSFIDTATAGGALSDLTGLALIFIGAAVGQQLINVINVYITENLGWATTNDVRLDLARFTLGLDMSFHTSHTPGEMIERLDGDVMALSNFFSRFILEVFGNMLLILGILLVLLRDNWRITTALAVYVAVTVFILLRLANIAVSSWEAERQSSAGLFGFLEERLSGTEDIRSNNAKDYVLRRFYLLTRDLMQKTIRAGLKVNILLNSTWFLFSVGTALSYLLGAALFRANMITIGTVYMIVYYTGMLYWPLDRITQQMQDLQKAGASLVRIINLQRIQGRIAGEENFSMPETNVLHDGPLGVEFDHVTFAYDDSVRVEEQNAEPARPDSLAEQYFIETQKKIDEKDLVLQDVSLRLEPGRVLGLLGRTGSGKTTLTRLIFRLYDTAQGSICLSGEEADGQVSSYPLRDVPVQELRRRVGMVTQNIQLFNATVRENLTFFNAKIPDEKIIQAIHDLDLSTWFASLPKGLDTELESGGGGLSAGEAQLLAFTRIFLRDPGLVILDEATSRLDPATESLIEQAVDKLIRNRSAIIVAHRLGTVQRVNDILILENGKVIEYGNRQGLAADPASHFHHLLQTGMEEVLV